MQHYQAKSIGNVLHWPILIISLLALTSLTGCANFSLFKPKVKPIEVITKPLEKTPLDIPFPDPIKTKPIAWVVITPENVESQFAKLQEAGTDVVFFAMTPDGYQQLAITIGDLRNMINQQRTIIAKYKEYYEPQVNKPEPVQEKK